MTAAELNDLSEKVIGAAIHEHRELGPGLLESCYEVCLGYELAERGLRVERQVVLPVQYGRQRIEAGFRIVLMVNGERIVEL